MDDIVQQAMSKWPDVPDCYGWLGLDARGYWRMRDARAQALGLAGDKIAHVALLAFINRNYGHDGRGCWYFQNGPQRVYVNLEATPYILRTDAAHGFLLHTGEPLGAIDAACMTEEGQLIVRAGAVVGQLDDRDGAHLLALLEHGGAAVDDDTLVAWLDGADTALTLRRGEQRIAVQRINAADIPAKFHFIRMPSSS